MGRTLTTSTRADGPGPGDVGDGATRTGPSTQIADGGDRRVAPLHLLLVAAAALVLAVLSFRPWPLDEPVLYSGDTLQHLAIVEATDAFGTPGTSADLGAPGSVDWSVFPTGTERLQLVVLHALDAATGDVFVTLNLYLLLGLTVTAVLACAVLRWMGLHSLVAGVAGVVFAFAPAVSTAVVGGHLFLFALFPVALGTYLALWSTMMSTAEIRTRPRSWVPPAAAVVVTALSSAYFSAFTLVLIAALAVVTSVRSRSWRRMVLPAITAAGLVAVAGLSLLPDLLRRAGDPTASALRRTAADVRRYSLRPQDLLVLDDGHPLGPLARALRSLGSSAIRPSTGSILGLVALGGCVVLVVVAVRHGSTPRDRDDRIVSRLAVVVAAVLAMAVTGGLGTLLGDLGFTQIRAWSRMVVFLSFAGLAGGSLVLQRMLARQRWSRTQVMAVVAVVGVFALLDQGLVTADSTAAQGARSDLALVEDMERVLGPGTSVFEVPVVSFPDDPGSGRLLAPAVVSDSSVRFSAGFFRGGDDDWQLSWCRRPTPQFVRAIAAVGFDALLVQRSHHLVDDRDALDDQLQDALGAPTGVSDDASFAWYDLRPMRSKLLGEHGADAVARAGRLVRRPIGVDYRGVTELRLVGRVMADGGDVILRRLDDDTAPVSLTMQVRSGDGEGTNLVQRTVDLADTSTDVEVPGDAPVTVRGVSVIDERSLDDPVLGPAVGASLPAVCM